MKPETIARGELTVRPWRADEASAYVDLRDGLVLRFTTESEDLDVATCRADIASDLADPSRARFAICGPDGAPSGSIAAVRLGDRAVISYWLAPGARGRGWAAAGLEMVTEWAFDTWRIVEAELEIDAQNNASMKVADNAGYLRSAMRLTSACGGPAFVYRRASPYTSAKPTGEGTKVD